MQNDPIEPESGGDPPLAEIEDGRSAARQAMDRLNDNNRIITESMMLNRNEKLTDQQVQDVVDRFTAYLDARGMTRAQAARECGYAPSTLSLFSSGKYVADRSGIAIDLNNWMERDSRRNQGRRPKNYVKTWIAEDIRTTVYQADKLRMMACVVVPSGAGKTMVLRALTDELNGVYVYCSDGFTARDLLRAIASGLGYEGNNATRGQLLRVIVERLTGTNRIIFVDEAQNAGKHIGALRSIYDLTQSPVIMAGSHEILGFINDRAHGRGQFSSRTIRYNALDYVRDAEGGPDGSERGRDLFTIEEIQAFFDSKRIRLDREATKMVWALACLPNHGTLRLVEATIETIFNTIPDVELVTREMVIDALQLLVGAGAGYLQNKAQRHLEISRSASAVAKAG